MAFITEGKTNLKYILIIIILAVIVGGGILVNALFVFPGNDLMLVFRQLTKPIDKQKGFTECFQQIFELPPEKLALLDKQLVAEKLALFGERLAPEKLDSYRILARGPMTEVNPEPTRFGAKRNFLSAKYLYKGDFTTMLDIDVTEFYNYSPIEYNLKKLAEAEKEDRFIHFSKKTIMGLEVFFSEEEIIAEMVDETQEGWIFGVITHIPQTNFRIKFIFLTGITEFAPEYHRVTSDEAESLFTTWLNQVCP